uniref:Retrovirus-related Pol polyprotein from transposon TNT 1-94 n=1 Tax=Tanacetum cinerariifolium TaxID=118510 RepID=A0A699GTW0_TANCI|nr:hypothetical protein [Tanacetum cinerariifolium]
MTTLAEFIIIAGADNRPHMLEKSLGCTTRTKKYEELSVAEKLQADCDLKATNIVLQGLPPDVYAIVNHHKVVKEIWDRVKLLIQYTKLSLQEKECLAVPVFSQGDDPITCLNKAIAFLTAVASSRQGWLNVIIVKVKVTWLGKALSQRGLGTLHGLEKAKLAKAQESVQILDEEQLAFLADPGIPDSRAAQTTIPNTAAFQTKDLNAYDFDCDDVPNANMVLMANLSNYDSDVISERIKPTLYDGSVISSQHAVSPVIYDEEILKEVSRSKMLAKQNDPMSKEKKVNTTPINYVELNRLSEDFGKRFVPQQELFDEEAFWLQTSHLNTDQSALSPVKIEAPKEFPKDVLLSVMNSTTLNGEYVNLGIFKLDIKPLSHRLKNNRDAHEDYLNKTIENTDTIRGLVERARKQNPSEPLLDSACKFTKHVQELLIYVSHTCPSFTKPSEKLVVVTPMNKVKKVRFSEPLTSSSNTHKQIELSKTPDSNTPVLPSAGLKNFTNASRSQPTGNKKNDMISRTPSSNIKNKVEVQRCPDCSLVSRLQML